jgi:hypothetical protein
MMTHNDHVTGQCLCWPFLNPFCPQETAMSKKRASEKNLPLVSKETAGGVTGAVIGGLVGGPVGAVAGGVAGAMVGHSSARGEKPIKKAVETIRSKLSGLKPKAVEGPESETRKPKTAKKKQAQQKPVTTKKAKATKKKQAKPKSKVATAGAKKRSKKRAKKKAR